MKIKMDVFPKAISWNTNHPVVPTNHHENKGSSTTRWFKIQDFQDDPELSPFQQTQNFRFLTVAEVPGSNPADFVINSILSFCRVVGFFPGTPKDFLGVCLIFLCLFLHWRRKRFWSDIVSRTRRIFPTKLQQQNCSSHGMILLIGW